MKYWNKNKLVIICTGIFFIVCLCFTLTLSLDEKITSMLPDSDPMVEDFNYIINNIPATETLYIDIENLQTDHKTFEQIADHFFDEINTSPYLSSIESKLTPERIHELLIRIKRKLLSPSGMFMADTLIDDPLGINELILSKLNPFKKETFGVKIKGSRIYSKDGTHLLMMATPNFSALDTQKSVQMIKFLNEARDKITKKYKSKIHIRFSGNHAATLDNSKTIQQDVKRAVFVLTVGIFFNFSANHCKPCICFSIHLVNEQ